VGLIAILEAVVKRKIPSSRQESNPRTPIVQPVDLREIGWEVVEWTHLAQDMDW
jgi:hypothetical protein